MGYKQSPGLIVAALLLLTPLAYGQILPNNGIANGIICCTPNGNCPPGAVGVPGVKVTINCTTLLNGVVKVAEGITNATGGFILPLNGTLGSVSPIVNGLLPCGVFVNLPLNSTVCPVLNTATGTLVGTVTFVRTIIDAVLGLLAILRVSPFVNVNIGG